MPMRSLYTSSHATAFLLLASIAFSLRSQAAVTVSAGWDLQATQPGTSFAGVPFQGVPLTTFNFGSGPQSVGNADTIVHRLAPANSPSTSIATELVALQLMTTVPADFGFGVGTYYMTLQSARGGPASTGRMTINFGPEAAAGLPHGTFDSFFDVFFDLRLGGLNGPIALSSVQTVTSLGSPWNHFAPPGAVLIPGVNHNLNGSSNENDFWPIGSYNRTFPTGAVQVVAPATSSVPDGGSTLGMLLVAVGFCSLGRLLQDSRRTAFSAVDELSQASRKGSG